jgi:hypothetical protein
MRRVVNILGAVVLGIAMLSSTGGPASAWVTPPCDFLTGGGFIITTASGTHPPAKANFGVGGGCKHGSPTWGHLEYIDHGIGLNVHWMTITGYFFNFQGPTSKSGQPTGSRFICGTARTNNPSYPTVDWIVRADDNGEPGNIRAGGSDVFEIRLSTPTQGDVYTTEFDSATDGSSNHLLVGGNIQLHKPNPSTSGSFSDPSTVATTCPSAIHL